MKSMAKLGQLNHTHVRMMNPHNGLLILSLIACLVESNKPSRISNSLKSDIYAYHNR